MPRVSRFYRLSLENHPLHIIATDGGSLAAPQRLEELLLAPGERRDVLIQGVRAGGSYRLMNLPYNRGSVGMMGGDLGTRIPFEMATVLVRGTCGVTRRHSAGPWGRGAPAPRAARRTFVLSEAMGMVRGRGMGMRFLINGREFDHARIDDRVRLGGVEDWEYINTTDMDHPMHVHTNAFQRVVRMVRQSRRGSTASWCRHASGCGFAFASPTSRAPGAALPHPRP